MEDVSRHGGKAGHVAWAADFGFVEPGPWRAIPRHAEPPPSAFVNRDAEFTVLRAGAEVGGRSRPAVIAVRGLHGVGKTALLQQFAATAADLFPDGVLSVSFGPGENAPDEAVTRCLLGLGVPEHLLPSTLGRKHLLFKSMSAGLRLLMLIDDVTDDAQVRALLPNSPGSMVIAASNRMLEGLQVDGAVDLELRALTIDDGVRLLGEMCGDRIHADQDSARELVAAYDGLPLAIRVAGARLAARPAWPLARLVEELRDTRPGPQPVEVRVFATFDVVYRDLSESLRLLYRALGAMVGVRFGPEVLAAVVDVPLQYVLEDLEELARAGLVEQHGPDTFRLHRLVQRHALHRSAEEDADEARQVWRERAMRWWLLGAMAADLAADPDRLRVPDPESVAGERPDLVSSVAGLAWLDREHTNLLAVLEAAAHDGRHVEVCRLFEALFALYKARKPLSAWVRAGKLAVASAELTGRPETEARCRCLFAKALQELERFDEAAAQLERARELVADGPERFTASTYDFTGNLCLRQGHPEAALGWFEEALAINRGLGLVRGTALQSMLAARALGALGRFDEALDLCASARDLVTGGSAATLLPKILVSTGTVLVAAERTDDAERTFREAVDLALANDNTADAADALISLANLGGGDADAHRQHAVRLLERMGSPRAARVIAGSA